VFDVITNFQIDFVIVWHETFTFTGCNVWTRKVNTAADSGVFYALKSESDCVAMCLTSLSCVGFDITPFGCTLHHDVGELTDSYYSPGVTQFVLNRYCLPVTPLSTGGSYTTTSSLPYTTSMWHGILLLCCRIVNINYYYYYYYYCYYYHTLAR